MNSNPSNILLKLEELKKWQEQQQERLMEQHNKRLLKIEVPKEGALTNKSSLESNAIKTNDAKPKRSFLHRGAGLSRFRMSPGDQFKPFEKPRRSSHIITKPKEKPQPLTPLKKSTVTFEPKAVWLSNEEKEIQLLPPQQQEIQSQSVPPNANGSADKDLLVFEALEQRVMQNSFCSTNSSIMRLLSSTPQKNREYGAFSQTSDVPEEVEEYDDLEVIQKQENQLQNDYLTLIEKAIKFKQFIAQKDDCVSSVTSDDVLSNCEAGTDFNDKSEWNENSNSENSSLNCHQLGNDVGTMTEIDLTEDFIQDKTQELESELNLLREESLKVTTLKTQLEQQQKEFEKLRKEAIKQVEDEKRNMNKLLEEEKKKLAKDKMVFERYIKDLQNKPSRKERAEISALKAEIATLKETLKVKESKNGMTQARLRNQIKTLEKDNSNLKEEIENLNRQNARLTVNQKVYRKPSDTKMLHEINRNLTKLAQTKFNKLRDSSSSDEKIVETKRNTSDNIEKENDKNMSNKDDFIEVEKNYEEAFNENQLPSRLSNGSFENTHRYNRTEETLPDGRKEVKYSNGNVKIVSPDGNLVIFKYYNGDVKETNLIEGTICYYYNDSQIKHTTNVKGSEIIEFPDGQIEERFKDGTCNIRYPNGISRKREDDGTENITYPDGTIVTVNSKGERVLLLPNGQKEIHTNEHKRREYPDGTVKILFPDGSQETRYASGRVRLKDRNGMLLMDTESVKTLT